MWVRRNRGDRTQQAGVWHITESLIAEAAVTRCGRIMEDNVPRKTWSDVQFRYMVTSTDTLDYKQYLDIPANERTCNVCHPK